MCLCSYQSVETAWRDCWESQAIAARGQDWHRLPFQKLLHRNVGEGTTPFPGLLLFIHDPYFIMLCVKRGDIKYHFLSLWYELILDWTQVFRVLGEHSDHYANGPFCVENIITIMSCHPHRYPWPLSPPLPIVHHFRQVLRTTFRIYTELLYVGSCWLPCLFSAICWGPQEYITYELVPTSLHELVPTSLHLWACPYFPHVWKLLLYLKGKLG